MSNTSNSPAHRPGLRLVGLCGSLRADSTNLQALRAAQHLLPAPHSLEIFTALDSLPPFNPDLSPDHHPSVGLWAAQMKACDGLLVSSPVYARGYPGSLKNALDWLVGGDAFVDKPFTLLNASPRSLEVHDTLITVLQTMSGQYIESATTTLDLLGGSRRAEEIVTDPAHAQQITQALHHFLQAIT